eukprot:13019444-Alexandrium_andersonii.AAC.1
MSASLVGSEMCIRDRCWANTTRHRRDRCAGCGRTSRVAPARRWSTAAYGCLLYTSDAADDM